MGAKFVYLSIAVLSLAVKPSLSAEPIAQVISVQGKVLLNQGDGFQTVEKMATIDVGDQLLVSKDAAVSLNYAAADCAATFKDPALVSVSSSAPCENKPGAKNSSSLGGGGGGTAVSGAAQRSSTPISIPSLGGGTTTSPTPTAVSR